MRRRTPVGVDKTLPKLQAETVNLGLLNPPSRSGLGLALDIPDNSRTEMPETSPLPCDQTPPTPTLHALRLEEMARKEKSRERETVKAIEKDYTVKNIGRKKSAEKARFEDTMEEEKDMKQLLHESRGLSDLRMEGGLDALERRLLKEVGTRKVPAESRRDVRTLLGVSAETNDEEMDNAHGTGRRRARRKSGESDRSRGGRSGAVTPSPKPRAGRVLAEDTNVQDVLRPRSAAETTAKTPDSTGQSVGGSAPTQPIQIPMQSPEPLNDSAISSLTLAGGLGGDDTQADEFGAGLGLNAVNVGLERGRAKEKEGGGSGSDGDGRTHRGRSRSGGSGSRGSSGSMERDEEGVRSGGLKAGGLRMHMRERASGEKLRERERERDAERDRASRGSKESRTSKTSKVSRPEKGKKTKSAASKGRVAAWLGGIDVRVPPMEEDIPPSPSAMGRFVAGDDDGKDERDDKKQKAEEQEQRQNEEKAKTTAPNPRSSGFVLISTLNRSTIILPGHGSTITGSGLPLTTGLPPLQPTSVITPGTTPPGGITPTPKFFYPLWASTAAVTSAANARPMCVRTDRRVSPPSVRPMPSLPTKKQRDIPMSYSAAAKTSRVSFNVHDISSNPGNESNTIENPDLTAYSRPPSFPTKSPAPLDPETKYDIRSARGGRGGKVPAVASSWAIDKTGNQC